jgi:hypothetical protein
MKPDEAAKLQTYLQRWRAVNPYRWQQGAQVVADDLLQDVAFTDIRIAGLLESPGGATITQVVESVLPFPGNAEAAVMIEAIEIAAKQQTSGQLVGALVIGALVALILWGLFREG